MSESYKPSEASLKQEAEYFENYEATNEDLEFISDEMNLLVKSGLFETGVLDEIRVVTYDSKNLYIFTKGEHISTDQFEVEEIILSDKANFRLFRIPHSGFFGRNKTDYQEAQAWLVRDEIEKTAINAKKFPNENVLYEPGIPQPKQILDVVSLPPQKAFERLNTGRYDYVTDVLFHEVGHIEHRRLKDWQEGEVSVYVFPSQKQEMEFKAVLEKSQVFSKEILFKIIASINKGSINEMYAMVIDREATRRYHPQKVENEDIEFNNNLFRISADGGDFPIGDFLANAHSAAKILVRILEEQIPEFVTRKEFVRKVLSKKSQS